MASPPASPSNSIQAAIKQGGGAGSALSRLSHATSIKKHASVPRVDAISLSREPTSEAASDQPTPSLEDMFVPVDMDDDAEFDVINPLYVHAGSSTRFQNAPQFGQSLLAWLSGYISEKMRTPTGRVDLVVTKATKIGSCKALRFRFTINGQSASVDVPTNALSLNVPVLLQYYRTIGSLASEDMAELQLEVSDSESDAFLGCAALSNVSALGSAFKTVCLELVSQDGEPIKAPVEVKVAYHAATFLDRMGLRGKWIVEFPRQIAQSLAVRARMVPSACRHLLDAGLPGIQGGAASWVVFAMMTVPYFLVTALTSWSWALRQWFLFLPLYAYAYVSWPVFFGWAFGTLITTFALHGYPGALKVGALHVSPWIRNWALHVRVTAEDAFFGNPPGFPLENFAECNRTDIKGCVSFRHLWDTFTLRYKRCPLKKVPDFMLLAKFDIDFIEFDGCMVDMQMYDGKFNIHAFSSMIAEGQAKNMAWMRGYMRTGDPMPNELEIRIIRAKDLVKTRTSSSALGGAGDDALPRTRSTITSPFGRNDVVDAFAEDVDKESDDEEESAPGGGARTPTQEGSTDTAPSMQYLGGGPPPFNPADGTVRPRANQGHFDPYVVVTLRRDKQKTHTQTKTNSPMFNETFFFHATDAATVMHVAVYNREVVGGDVMLGQWIMTLKWMLGDPYYCWHEKGMQVTPDRWMRGWFPLMNKRYRGVGKCGKLEMALQWRYVPEDKLRRKVELPPLTALAQLQENSAESRMRMGDLSRVKFWLNREPFLYDIKRVTVRGIRYYVQDLFRGYKGRAERVGVAHSHCVEIMRLDYLTEFRPRHGDLGITTYKVVYNFFRGVAPKVLDSATSHATVGSAVGQIMSGVGVQMTGSLGSGLRHLMRGEVHSLGPVQSLTSSIGSVGKSADRAVRLLHQTVTKNRTDEAQFKTLVHGDDEDFLIETPALCGYLARYAVKSNGAHTTDTDMERESQRKGSFRQKWFELKGKTLFYRKHKQVHSGSLFATSFKIPLANITGAIYFVDRDELILNQQVEGCMTRLRMLANDKEDDDDEEEVVDPSSANPSLRQWMEALKVAGVPCYLWEREKHG